MGCPFSTRFVAAAISLLGVACAPTTPRQQSVSNVGAPSGIQAGADEKASRTPAQRKIDSQILYEIYRAEGRTDEKGVPPGETIVRIDATGRALVDIRAEVSQALNEKVEATGGTIVSVSARDQSTIAWTPLLKIEAIAEDPAVSAIVPAATPQTLR